MLKYFQSWKETLTSHDARNEANVSVSFSRSCQTVCALRDKPLQVKTRPPRYIPSLERNSWFILQSAVLSCLIILNTESKAPDLCVSWFIIPFQPTVFLSSSRPLDVSVNASSSCWWMWGFTDCEEQLWHHSEQEIWKHGSDMRQPRLSTDQETLSGHVTCWKCKAGSTFQSVFSFSCFQPVSPLTTTSITDRCGWVWSQVLLCWI